MNNAASQSLKIHSPGKALVVYEMRRHVLPTAPSPTTTHLIACISGGTCCCCGCNSRISWQRRVFTRPTPKLDVFFHEGIFEEVLASKKRVYLKDSCFMNNVMMREYKIGIYAASLRVCAGVRCASHAS